MKLHKRKSLILECLNQAPVDGLSGSSYGTSGLSVLVRLLLSVLQLLLLMTMLQLLRRQPGLAYSTYAYRAVALGYVYGGVVGGSLNWRYAFWGEGILMLPFAILGFVAKPLQLKGFGSAGSTKTVISGEADGLDDHGDDTSVPVESVDQKSKNCKFFQDMKILLSERVYVVNVLGYIAYNFVIGAYSYWGPKAGYNIYHMSNADMTFGGITVISGIFGTITGGYILDYVTSTIRTQCFQDELSVPTIMKKYGVNPDPETLEILTLAARQKEFHQRGK